jgi:hypothetical protein
VKISISKVVVFVCLALISSLVPAAAEDFTNAIHAYLQQCVHAEIPNGCIVVGVVDEHGSKVVSCGTLDNGTSECQDDAEAITFSFPASPTHT